MRTWPRRRVAPNPALRVGLFGILGSGNWGNDGSMEVVHDFLLDRLPGARLGFMVMGPEVITQRYGGQASHLQWYVAHMDRLAFLPRALLKVVGRLLDPFRTLRWVRRQDVVIVPGAGVLETRTTRVRPWGMPASLLMLGIAARLTGTRLAYVCVGADAGRPGPTYRVIAHAAALADYRSYRDEMSRAAVREMGVDVSRDRVFPDLAFGLDSPPPSVADPRAVGVGVMNYSGGNDDRAESDALHVQYVDGMRGLVRWLVDRGRPVRLFTGDRGDEVILRDILAAAREGQPDAPVSEASVASLAELMDVMSGVGTVVGSRYHNVVTALKLGIPTLSISYARKSDVLMAESGLADFCQPARSVDLAVVTAKLEDLDRRRDEVVASMAEANRLRVAGIRAQLDDFADFLGAPPAG
jgi:polysaccharide pyruvyl transferase WcaK-like protein